MAQFLKSPRDTLWHALSRQERRAYGRYSDLMKAAARSLNKGGGEMHAVVREARAHWRRTVAECDKYLMHRAQAQGI